MNKIVLIFVAMIALISSAIVFAGDKGKQSDGPLNTERYKTRHGVVVSNEFGDMRHTCINSNPHSRWSSRSEVCFVQMKKGDEWTTVEFASARDSSVWRSMGPAIMNGTGAALVQGHFAVKAAEASLCQTDACRLVFNNNTNTNVTAHGGGAVATGGTATVEHRPSTNVHVNTTVNGACPNGGCPGRGQ